jgi:non-ribosomal peptide synthetase component F
MHLGEIAARTPAKAAIVMTDGSPGRSYAELDRRSRQVANLLRAHGVGPKDHVALLMDNSPEFSGRQRFTAVVCEGAVAGSSREIQASRSRRSFRCWPK